MMKIVLLANLLLLPIAEKGCLVAGNAPVWIKGKGEIVSIDLIKNTTFHYVVKDKDGKLLDCVAPSNSEKQRIRNEEGYYTSTLVQKDYPKIQILIIKDLLDGNKPKIPFIIKAQKRAEDSFLQGKLL